MIEKTPIFEADGTRSHELPKVVLKTKIIYFDDRLQQVRIQHIKPNGDYGRIEFLNYADDDGFYYMKKYTTDWVHRIII